MMSKYSAIGAFLLKALTFLKVSVVFISSKAMTAITVIVDSIKRFGVARFFTFIFVLGFFFRALYNYIFDRNFGMFILSIARIFVAAENDIIEYTNTLTTGIGLSWWNIIILYLNILGSIVIFMYMIMFLNWCQRELSSNSSLRGLFPTTISVILLAIVEYVYLVIIALTSNGGDIAAIVSVEVIPFRGIWTLVWSLPLLLNPFNINISTPSNETVEELLNTTNVETSRGFVTTMICKVLPWC